MKLEDAELVRQTLAGNKNAFSELVRRYSGLICGLAYHFVGNMADAEDLAQEAFLRAYQNLMQLQNPAKFGQWLRQITANLCRNWNTRYSNDARGIQLFDPAPGSRDIRQFAQIASQQPLPDEIVEKKELQETVRVAIDSLSEKNRLTVILFYMHDLSHQDVSHFLGIPVSAVKGRLHKSPTQSKDFQLEEGTKISGRLTDEEGNPLEGRRLYIYGLTFQGTTYYLPNIPGKTDAEGKFCIKGLPKGSEKVDLTIHNVDYIYEFNFEANQSPTVGMTDLHIVEFKPPDAQISGTVVDAETGQPIPKFHIKRGYPKADNLDKKGKIYDGIPPELRFYNAWGSIDYYNAWGRWNPLRVITYLSSDGKFTIEHLPPEEKSCLLVTAEGYTSTEAGPFLATPKPDASKLTIKMQLGKTIRGVVTDNKSEQPIYGAMVTYFIPTQPYAHEGQVLPNRIRIPTEVFDFTLPLGGETVCTKKNREYEITTAQTKDNYLLVTYPGYSPAIIGPISITETALDLPIALTQ